MESFKYYLIMGAAACLFSSCVSQMKMALTNPRWEGAQPHAVQGRNQNVFSKKPLKFAEFYTSDYHSSWKKSTGSMVGIGTGGTWQQPYYENAVGYLRERSRSSARFVLNGEGSRRSQVYTFNNFDGARLVIGKDPNSNLNWLIDALQITGKSKKTYYIQVFQEGAQKPWELLMDPDAAEWHAEKYEGYFALDKEHYYYIRPSNKVNGKNGPVNIAFGLIGFEVFDRYNKPVAAVSRINNGEVYLNTTDSDERFLLANLCTALLLYDVDA